MDELAEELLEMLDDYSVKEILQRLVEAMAVAAPEEENPKAWERGAKSLERLAASKDFEDMVSW